MTDIHDETSTAHRLGSAAAHGSALTAAEKYAEPSGPQGMRGCSQERVEEQLRVALDGHPESELWGENGLIAATMRAARMAMDDADNLNETSSKDSRGPAPGPCSAWECFQPIVKEQSARPWVGEEVTSRPDGGGWPGVAFHGDWKTTCDCGQQLLVVLSANTEASDRL